MRRRAFDLIFLLLGLTVVGTVGLRLIEGASWFECLYMAVITLSTVGFAEVFPLSDAGRAFIIVFLIVGLGTFSFSAFTLAQTVVSYEFRYLWEKRKMDKAIDKLSNHYIVCGKGRMGTTICEYLAADEKDFVVIDTDESVLENVGVDNGWLYIDGDATDDHVLEHAGIKRAKALATALPTDADNVYVVLSARLLNSSLPIIARASDEKAIEKLTRAGATRVISPFSSGAVKMARFMLHPSIDDFLEIADNHGNDLQLADVQVGAESPLVGKPLKETDFAEKGVMIIGIRRASGQRLIPPAGSTVIEAGDSLYAFGSSAAVNDVVSETDVGK